MRKKRGETGAKNEILAQGNQDRMANQRYFTIEAEDPPGEQPP